MKVLFATNLGIDGCQSNEARVNGKNVAIIAMGAPFGAMFKADSRDLVLAEIIFCRELIDAQLPDIDGLVVATEGSLCLARAKDVFTFANARKRKSDWQLGFHLVTAAEPTWAKDYELVFHPSQDTTGSLSCPLIMRYMLERYLATSKLTGQLF